MTDRVVFNICCSKQHGTTVVLPGEPDGRAQDRVVGQYCVHCGEDIVEDLHKRVKEFNLNVESGE